MKPGRNNGRCGSSDIHPSHSTEPSGWLDYVRCKDCGDHNELTGHNLHHACSKQFVLRPKGLKAASAAEVNAEDGQP